MIKPVQLLGLSGSLRKDSYATAILKTLAEQVGAEAEIAFGDIGSLPLYNADLDTDTPPKPVETLRSMLANSDGLVICLPEYNHGMPGVLKNAIDWLSSPPPTAAIKGKPVFVVSSSPGFTGGARAQIQLRETLFATKARVLPVPEVIIGDVSKKIQNGRLTDTKSLEFALAALHLFIAEIRA